MTTRARVVLLTLGLVTASVLIFLPEVADKLIAYKTTWPAAKNATSADSLSHLNRAPSKTPILSRSATTYSSPSAPPWDILRRTTATRHTRAVKPTSIKTPAWQMLLAESGPKARELFESGMSYFRNGDYLKARLAFQTLVRTYPGDKAEPLAYWALALSYYREGGDENRLLALDHFRNFLIFYPGEEGLEDFAEAAQMDVAVIEIEMMNSALNEYEEINAARVSAQALTQFLKAYPDSPAASAARIQLAGIQWYLARTIGK